MAISFSMGWIQRKFQLSNIGTKNNLGPHHKFLVGPAQSGPRG